MRQLAYSYSFPTGFVQAYPQESDSNLYGTAPVANRGSLPNLGGGIGGNSMGLQNIVLWGLSLEQMPTQVEFSGFNYQSLANWNSSFLFPSLDAAYTYDYQEYDTPPPVPPGAYLFMAAPTSMGAPTTIVYNGFPLTLVTSNVTLIFGDLPSIPYTIYASQYVQHGEGIIWTTTQ